MAVGPFTEEHVCTPGAPLLGPQQPSEFSPTHTQPHQWSVAKLVVGFTNHHVVSLTCALSSLQPAAGSPPGALAASLALPAGPGQQGSCHAGGPSGTRTH